MYRHTEACQGGRVSLVVLRCDTTADNADSVSVCVYRHTEACQGGRVSLVVLRCDTTADNADSVSAELSRRCAVGTCDGCHFVFLMRSRAACPLCTKQDFHTYKTLCVNGRRSVITDMITYVSLSVCLFVCLSFSLSVCLSLCHSTRLCVSVYVEVLSLT